MTDFVHFGTPGLLEIAARWTPDSEPRERLPEEGGWSTGDLQITIGRQIVTGHRFDGIDLGYSSWYLSPILDWLVTNWTLLFHEESFAWSENSGAPAATAVFAALGRTIGSSDADDRREYQSVQQWWKRHALRAADPSALYPDLCFRRLGDDIEVSWTGRQPVHAPEGFALTASPGFATFGVAAVAGPLWEFLQWGLGTAPIMTAADDDMVDALRRRFQQLKRTPLKALELAHLDGRLQELLSFAKSQVKITDSSVRMKEVPVIECMDPAVLMFGGLSPSIGRRDAVQLLRFLKKHQDGTEKAELKRLVDDRPWNPSLAPFEEGYELAEEVREQLHIPPAEHHVNMRLVLHDLGVSVHEISLDTDTVRGVAVAGAGFSAAILVNMTSAFNQTREGQNFTLAHELCHILFDRTRAKRLSHVSGAWTAPRTEKRANAFAAMFLASRTAVRAAFLKSGLHEIRNVASALQLGHSAMIEHLYNLRLINEADREQLRSSNAA